MNELAPTDKRVTEWIQTVNEKFREMDEYQIQTEIFQGDEAIIWEKLVGFWNYFMLGY